MEHFCIFCNVEKNKHFKDHNFICGCDVAKDLILWSLLSDFDKMLDSVEPSTKKELEGIPIPWNGITQ